MFPLGLQKVVKKPIKSKAKKGDNDDAETPNAMPQSLEDLGLGQIMGSKNVVCSRRVLLLRLCVAGGPSFGIVIGSDIS